MSQLALLVDGVIVQLFPLEKQKTTIGRSLHCDICIDDASASTNHAVIHVRPSDFLDGHDEIFLEDLGSRNGTRVNDRKIDRCQLKPDDVITIAWNRFKLLDDQCAGGESTVLLMTD
jgi:pSer/pThr/pTyr-binding forkhead associated (FHA) protein